MMGGPMVPRGPGQGPRGTGTGMRGPMGRGDYGKFFTSILLCKSKIIVRKANQIFSTYIIP